MPRAPSLELLVGICLFGCAFQTANQIQPQDKFISGATLSELESGAVSKILDSLQYYPDIFISEPAGRIFNFGIPGIQVVARDGPRHKSPRVRMLIAYLVRAFGNPDFSFVLEKLEDDSVPEVRYAAASALLQMGFWDHKTTSIVLQGLAENSLETRYHCFSALSNGAHGLSFGYHWSASEPARKLAIAKWHDFVEVFLGHDEICLAKAPKQ